MSKEVRRVQLPSRLDAIAGLAEEVDAMLPDHPTVAFQVNLCLDELLTNTITHGLGGATDHVIEVELCREGDWLDILIEDDAPPYDPFAGNTAPDLEADLDDRPIGGLGVHFVQTLMDSAVASQAQGGNRLMLRKRLGDVPD